MEIGLKIFNWHFYLWLLFLSVYGLLLVYTFFIWKVYLDFYFFCSEQHFLEIVAERAEKILHFKTKLCKENHTESMPS